MLMRDSGGNPLGHERTSRQRKLRPVLWVLSGVATLFLGSSAVIATLGDSSPGGSNAPWLSGDSTATHSLDDYIWLVVGGVLAAFVAGFMSALMRLIRSRAARSGRQSGPKKTVWRYREMSRREKRLLAAGLMLSCSIAGVPLTLFGLDGDKGDVFLWPFVASTALGALTGLVMSLVQVRPSRTVMQIVEDRAERELALRLEQLRAEDARQMNEWKNETMAALFAMIMDQVERGVITCRKCPEGHDAVTRKAGETKQPPAPCGGGWTGDWKPKRRLPVQAENNEALRAIGQSLRSARIDRGLSVDDVSEGARMRRPIVIAMEKGHFTVFGGDMTARAHIRTYANQVGLDAHALLQQYEAGKRRAA